MFQLCLRYEDAIKRIPVMQRQGGHVQGVDVGYGKRHYRISHQSWGDKGFRIFREWELAERILDGYLPTAGCREKSSL